MSAFILGYLNKLDEFQHWKSPQYCDEYKDIDSQTFMYDTENGKSRKISSTKLHESSNYPEELQKWPPVFLYDGSMILPKFQKEWQELLGARKALSMEKLMKNDWRSLVNSLWGKYRKVWI